MFLSPNNDVVLKTVDSPVLQREGYTQNSFEEDDNHVPTMEGSLPSAAVMIAKILIQYSEWTFAKQKWQRTKNAVRGDPKYETAQILPGHNEKFYA